MSKPRAPSDPSPSTGAENVNNHQTFTLPARVPRDQRSAEPFPTISASMILGMDVSHSGWVRKEGFGYRSWKSRFMVLHHGCLYYFKETDSNAPKGKFALNGYRCFPAPDRERADRYPYVFKLVPDDERRVYYISSPSKTEMEGWMNSITSDIQHYCPSEYDYVETSELGKSATCPTVPKTMPIIKQRAHGEGYVANSDKAFPHSFPKTLSSAMPAPLLPPKPFSVLPQSHPEELDDQDVYETVDPESFEQHYLPVVPTDEPDGGNSSYLAKPDICKLPSPTNGGRPVPPVRPKPPPRPPDMHEDSESDGEDSDEDAWYVPVKTTNVATLRFQAPTSPRNNGLSPTSPERECPLPLPPVQNGAERPLSDEVDVTYLSVIGNKEFQDILKDRNPENAQTPEQNHPKPPPRPSPKPPPRNRRPSEDTLDKKEFDYLPPGCFKKDLPKQQAKIFLELSRTVGEYMINASQTSDTGMSLSVWLGNGVKHYLIFKRQELFTLDPSLTKEQFTGLNELVKYYFKHPLPKSSGQYLTAPFSTQCIKSS